MSKPTLKMTHCAIGEAMCCYTNGSYADASIALTEYENSIRADERKKCGEELLKVINEKPYGTEKNNWWLISQIKHFCFGVPRICDIMEEQE